MCRSTPIIMAGMLGQLGQNPAMMMGVLRHIMQNQPEMFQQMNNGGQIDQGAIEQLLQNPRFLELFAGALGQGGMGGGGGGGGGPAPPRGANVIQLTREQAASIDRLQALGFSKQLALEAFLVCGKN